MRVLWFVNVPLEPLLRHWGRKATGTGFWMNALLAELRGRSEIDELGVVCAGIVPPGGERVEVDGVTFFNVPLPRLAMVYGFGLAAAETRALAAMEQIVAEFRPDLLHFHGTERFYGRLKSERRVDVPAVVSIQGLMGPYAPYALGDKRGWELLKHQRVWDLVRLFPSLRSRANFRSRSRTENASIRSMEAVMGRTAWDRAHTWAIAPGARYHHVDEMLRPEFFAGSWRLGTADPLTLYTTARLTFLKGMHVLLEAVALVRREIPAIRLRVGADAAPTCEYWYMRGLIQRLGIEENVELLGWIPSDLMVAELQRARVFVYPSFIENSSNAVQEAMLVGTPVVATAVGGMDSIIRHEESGILVRAGDPAVLAWNIVRLLRDDALSERLGSAACAVARAAHDPERITSDLLGAYRSVVRVSDPRARSQVGGALPA